MLLSRTSKMSGKSRPKSAAKANAKTTPATTTSTKRTVKQPSRPLPSTRTSTIDQSDDNDNGTSSVAVAVAVSLHNKKTISQKGKQLTSSTPSKTLSSSSSSTSSSPPSSSSSSGSTSSTKKAGTIGREPLKGGFLSLAVATQENKQQEEEEEEHDDGNDTKSAWNTARYLYFKKHTPKLTYENALNEEGDEGDDSKDRTIFIMNIPFNWTFQDVSEVFSAFGPVDSVMFLDEGADVAGRPSSIPTRSAHLIFESVGACHVALNTDTSTSLQPYTPGSAPTGLQKWLSDYQRIRPDTDALQSAVDRFMSAFDARTEEEKKSRIVGSSPDAEGWIKVVSKNAKRKHLPRGVDEEKLAKQKKKADKEQKLIDSVHFYRHREREQKQQELAMLRTKFAEDKKRIEVMRSQRKFKPY